MRMRLAGLVCLALYVGTIFAANWAITRYGLVTVAPGLVAPAGVYFAGLAFTLRDLTQNLLGRRWVVAAILAGAAASWVVSSSFAIASAVAFLISETADFAVYTPLAERRWLAAVAASNVVGAVVDSVVFLTIAFHSLDLLRGQVVGKLWMTLLAVIVLSLARRRYPRLAVEAA
jgi:queuosine precursor transporter